MKLSLSLDTNLTLIFNGSNYIFCIISEYNMSYHSTGYIFYSIELTILAFIFFNLFILVERGREGESKGEKHQCVVASLMPSAGDLAHNTACDLTGNRTGETLVCNPCSIHWATPARVILAFILTYISCYCLQ